MPRPSSILSAALLGALLTAPAAQAVSEAACLWLLITPSARSAGLGGAVSPLSDDPTDGWFAPGLGAARPLAGDRWIEFDFSGYPDRVGWLPAFGLRGVGLENWNLGVRLDLNRMRQRRGLAPLARPLVLEVRLLDIQLDEGYQTYTNEAGSVLGVIHSVERSRSLRLGLGTHGERWSLAAGLGHDDILSDLASGLVGSQVVGAGEASGWDFGLNGRYALVHEERDGLVTDWTAGLQLSRLFVGDGISYSERGEADPLPRHDRLGLATRLLFSLPAAGDRPELPLLDLHLAFERSASLVDKHLVSRVQMTLVENGQELPAYWTSNGELTTDPTDEFGNPTAPAWHTTYGTDYRFANGDLLAGSVDAPTSFGWELGLLSTLTWRQGHYANDAGSIHEDTQGWTISSRGPLELAARHLPGALGLGAALAARHLEFQWSRARLDSDSPRDGTEYREYRVTLGF